MFDDKRVLKIYDIGMAAWMTDKLTDMLSKRLTIE